MKILLILLFPLCTFAQLPAGKYLKVKDDGTGFELFTLSYTSPTRLSDSTAALRVSINTKQETLVNQTNIKSVNGNSLLGSGDISISSAVAFNGITGVYTDNASLVTGFGTKEPTINSGTTAQYWRGDK